MRDPHICLDCLHVGDLSRHGRCEVCDSKAVDVAIRTPRMLILPARTADQVQTLERMLEPRK